LFTSGLLELALTASDFTMIFSVVDFDLSTASVLLVVFCYGALT
jgi:hypothetical protein